MFELLRNYALGLAGLGAVAALVLSPSAAQAPEPITKLVVIGDSLSDSGNAGRYSNGPVWVEYLADRLAVPLEPSDSGGTNFAIGGAKLDPESGPTSLPAQLERYLSGGPPGTDRALHVVFGGGNDLLAALGATNEERIAKTAAEALAGIVDGLMEAGATEILVPVLPDVGMAPAVRNYGPEAMRRAARLSADFNDAVDQELARLVDGTASIHRLDIRAMGERVLAEPAEFGFRNVTGTCSGAPSCEGYLFWDHLHPTTQAHRRLGEAAFELLEEARASDSRGGTTEP